MSRLIVPVIGFEASVAALGSSVEVQDVVRALISRVERDPERARKLPGLEARVIKSRSFGTCPAIRLLYRVTADSIYLYEVAVYDELAE